MIRMVSVLRWLSYLTLGILMLSASAVLGTSRGIGFIPLFLAGYFLFVIAIERFRCRTY